MLRYDSTRFGSNWSAWFSSSKALSFWLLREEHAAHQNMTFDVVRIFCENFLGESFGFRNDVGATAAAGEIVVAELDARFEIVLIESYGLAQLIDHFRKALETFKRARQTPVGRGEFVVDLNRIAKLKRGFLKL